MKLFAGCVTRALLCVVSGSLAVPAFAADPYEKTIPVPATATAEQPVTLARSTDWWPSIGIGGYGAEDYKGGPNATHDGTHIGGGEADAAFTYAWLDTGFLLRLRASTYTQFTSNQADEIALLAGVSLGASRKLWFTGGISRLSDVSNTQQAPTVGIPLELIFYPLRGLELVAHGNINGDRGFYGFTVNWAIGRRRPDR